LANIRIECLVGKTNKSGVTSWYWQPSAALKRDGWESLPLGQGGRLGEPPADVVDAARARNDEVAKAAARPAGTVRPAAPKPVTVGDLIARYRAEGYPSVKSPGKFVEQSTAEEYEQKFKAILFWAGASPIAAITPERVDVFKEALLEPATSGRWAGQVRYTSAHAHLRVLRTLFSYAEQKRLIPKGSNPADDFGLSNPDPRDEIWWEPARAALFETAAGDVMMEAAAALAFCCAQREADLLRLNIRQYGPVAPYLIEDRDIYELLSQTPVPAYDGRSGYAPGDVWGINLRQTKTQRPVGVPIVGADRARIEAAIERAKAAQVTTILFDDRPPPETHWAAKDWRPRPWTMPNLKAGQRRFINRFAELRDDTIRRLLADYAELDDQGAVELAVEIAELQFRDFRRTAAVTMAERGVSDINIAGVTGWSLDYTRKIIETYVPRTYGSAGRAVATFRARAPEADASREGRG
jgi:hypothetical protein